MPKLGPNPKILNPNVTNRNPNPNPNSNPITYKYPVPHVTYGTSISTLYHV